MPKKDYYEKVAIRKEILEKIKEITNELGLDYQKTFSLLIDIFLKIKHVCNKVKKSNYLECVEFIDKLIDHIKTTSPQVISEVLLREIMG